MFSRFLWLTGFVVLTISPSAGAQVQPAPEPSPSDSQQSISAEKKALVMEFLEVTNSKKNAEALLNSMFDEMQKQMPDMVWNSIAESVKDLTPADQKVLRDEMTASMIKANQRFRELFSQRVDFTRLITDISMPLYAKYFSEAE